MHRKYFSTTPTLNLLYRRCIISTLYGTVKLLFAKMCWAVFSHMFRFFSSSWSIFQPLSSSGVQACFTHKKSCLCEIIDFCSVCLPLNPVIKETLDIKAGHMLSTAGIWCQWKEIESSFTWKYKNWPDPVYWGIEELARRACLVKDLKIKMGRIRNVRSRSSGQLLESEGFACFCHSLPTKSNGNGSWRDCYRFSYKRKENVMYNV